MCSEYKYYITATYSTQAMCSPPYPKKKKLRENTAIVPLQPVCGTTNEDVLSICAVGEFIFAYLPQGRKEDVGRTIIIVVLLAGIGRLVWPLRKKREQIFLPNTNTKLFG